MSGSAVAASLSGYGSNAKAAFCGGNGHYTKLFWDEGVPTSRQWTVRFRPPDLSSTEPYGYLTSAVRFRDIERVYKARGLVDRYPAHLSPSCVALRRLFKTGARQRMMIIRWAIFTSNERKRTKSLLVRLLGKDKCARF